MALDSAINSLFKNLFGSAGGLLSKGLFPSAPMGGSPMSGIGLFAEGGVSNKPAIFGESGPEAAVPLPDGRHIPVKMMNGGNGASQRTVVDVNVSVDDDGKLVVIARQAGSQAGAEQADARVRSFSQRELPDRMNQIKMNPRQR